MMPPMTAREQERREKLERERERLLGQIQLLEGDWKRLPWAFGTAILGLPAGIVWGWPWGALVIALGLSFGATGAYLIGVRREDYRRQIGDVERELRRLEAPVDGRPGSLNRR